jgi:hypothetical protein
MRPNFAVAPIDLLQCNDSNHLQDQKRNNTCCCWFGLDISGAKETEFIIMSMQLSQHILVRRLISTDIIVVYIMVRVSQDWARVASRFAADYNFIHPVGDESIVSFLASVKAALFRTTAEPLDGWCLMGLLKGEKNVSMASRDYHEGIEILEDCGVHGTENQQLSGSQHIGLVGQIEGQLLSINNK